MLNKEPVKISRNVFEGYLTPECPTCDCWLDGSDISKGIGCSYPGPIDHCEAFHAQYELDRRRNIYG